MLASLCLRVLHFCYYLALSWSTFWKFFFERKPLLLTAVRAKVPSHLALLLVVKDSGHVETVEKNCVESIVRTVTWCQAVGIRQLTVYDSQGIVVNCSQIIQTRLIAERLPCEDDTDSEVEYPLTPPLSDTSESRSMSPDYDGQPGMVTIEVAQLQAFKSRRSDIHRNILKRRKGNTTSTIPLTLNLVSRGLSKPAIVSAARSYVRTLKRQTNAGVKFELSADELGSTLQGRHGLPSPDFMIIHHVSPKFQPSLELYGFPPWQIQLTELYLNKPSRSYLCHSMSLFEEDFRAALDEFANAEMRLGK